MLGPEDTSVALAVEGEAAAMKEEGQQDQANDTTATSQQDAPVGLVRQTRDYEDASLTSAKEGIPLPRGKKSAQKKKKGETAMHQSACRVSAEDIRNKRRQGKSAASPCATNPIHTTSITRDTAAEIRNLRRQKQVKTSHNENHQPNGPQANREIGAFRSSGDEEQGDVPPTPQDDDQPFSPISAADAASPPNPDVGGNDDPSAFLAVASLVDQEVAVASVVEEKDQEAINNRCLTKLGGMLLCFVVIVLVGVVLIVTQLGGGDTSEPTSEASSTTTTNNTNATIIPVPTASQEAYPPFTLKLLDISIEIIETDPISPQARANSWIFHDPNLEDYPLDRSLARFALATLYFATNGDSWTHNTDWLNYDVHECDWYTSHYESPCDDEGQLVVVNLTGNALNGTATSRELLFYLPRAHTVDFSNNSLEENPPLLLGERPGLIHMDYSGNNLNGWISAELGWANEDLQVMRLQDNRLSGAIPSIIYSIFPMAEEINLARNAFVGAIPGQVLRNNNTHLKRLNLEENRLEGTLPSSLEHLVGLEVLDVSGNPAITGTIPSELETLGDLKVFDVKGTSLTGSIPEGLCQLENSQQLHIIAECGMIDCC